MSEKGMGGEGEKGKRGLRKGYTNRRDLCFFVGKRAAKLTTPQMVYAWEMLARHLEGAFSEMDVPKFGNLIALVRAATIRAASQIK